jgi:carbamoyl-phosphate synthase large subunit
LVTHAGGRIGLGFARCLRASGEKFRIIGVDSDEFHIQRAEADERHLVPRANDPAFLPVLRRLIKETEPDVLWVQHEGEIALVSRAAEEGLGVRTLLPDAEAVALCQDKMASYSRWKAAGLPVPESILLNGPNDLRSAFGELGPSLWLRSVRGAGGKGSLPVDDYGKAWRWIEFHQGWGSFVAAERMTESSVAWECLWHEGDLIAGQGRLRMYWELANLTPSGVTGITGAERFIADPAIDDLAIRAIRSVDPVPHGAYNVDLSFDQCGRPRITEVNIGRFGSSGPIHFPVPGFNLPLMAVHCALGRRPDGPLPILNRLPGDVYQVHGVGTDPVIAPVGEVQRLRRELQQRTAISLL